MKILIYVSFLGTKYSGYQIQKNAPTVQQALCEASERVFGFKCDVTGCSRTDSGVHANMFCAAVSESGKSGIDTTIPIKKIPLAYAAVLPNDIAVFDAKEVDDDFHPRYDVEYKDYVYKIYNRSISDPFMADRSWHYPRVLDDGAVERMNEAAARFVGKHDFASFMSSGSDVTDTVRTIFEAEVKREGALIEFRVSADGFLYNMVRILTGTLIAVAEGKIEPTDIDAVIESRDRKRAGVTAPPTGLYLNRVVYRD